MEHQRPFLGVLLAGGRGERMGGPKAHLPWPGGDLVTRGVEILGEVCASVAVATGVHRGERVLPPGTGVLEDAAPGEGPLGAIVPGLEAAAGRGLRGVLVLPCDMPLAGPAELLPLMDAVAAGAEAALWAVDGRLQPLCAAYASGLAPRARALFDGGARRPVALLEPDATEDRDGRVRVLEPPENSRLRLMNVNRRSDYDLALLRFHESQGRRSPGPRGPDRG